MGYPKFFDVGTLFLTEQEEDMFINLTPYLNSGAFTVRPGIKLDRVFTMVRNLGLRHLTVTDIRNRVQGIITRKDLMPHTTAESLEMLQQAFLEDKARRERGEFRTDSSGDMEMSTYRDDESLLAN